jgi:hypothetical protein
MSKRQRTTRPQGDETATNGQQSGNLFDADLSVLDPELDKWLDEIWDEIAAEEEAKRAAGEPTLERVTND